ncbi:hypothetical protein ACIQUQ_30185 [Streptomyces sp. NPDC101118]|uniref:YxiG-like protein n=1 Tax=Streptomyces sp. NPDC101118 TaxID=3366109 RepID=UPI0037FBC0EB
MRHGYGNYMGGYEVVVYATADPRTGVAPAYLRYLFRHCVEARCGHILTLVFAASR